MRLNKPYVTSHRAGGLLYLSTLAIEGLRSIAQCLETVDTNVMLLGKGITLILSLKKGLIICHWKRS